MPSILSVGHHPVRGHTKAVGEALRSHCLIVSHYFDQKGLSDLLAMSEFPAAYLLLLWLSHVSGNEKAPGHTMERDVLERAIEAGMPTALVYDPRSSHGGINASYLKRERLGARVNLIVVRERHLGCSPTELCEHARVLCMNDIGLGARELAREIHNVARAPQYV